MKIIIKSNYEILDKQFISHLYKILPVVVFTKENIDKLKRFDSYLNEVIDCKFSIQQTMMIILRNIIFDASGKETIIQINPNIIFPYTKYKVKDVASLINDGNLDIKGTHIFSDLFRYIEQNIEQLRLYYEMGLF